MTEDDRRVFSSFDIRHPLYEVKNAMHKKKILFVDDEPVVLRLMKTRLESRGFEVDTADNGIAAIEKAEAHRPDVILLDIIMPGIDGFETCGRLKKNDRTKDIPVFLFTALQESALEKKAAEAGAVKVIQKPHIDELLTFVNEFLK